MYAIKLTEFDIFGSFLTKRKKATLFVFSVVNKEKRQNYKLLLVLYY